MFVYTVFVLCVVLRSSGAVARLVEHKLPTGLPQDYLYPALPIAAPWSEDEACRADSRRLIANLQNKTLWAMQMMDSSVRAPLGVLYGNTFQFGHFDECLRVVAPVKAQYCLAEVYARYSLPPRSNNDNDGFVDDPKPESSVWRKFEDTDIDPIKKPRSYIRWGLCVPASCSAHAMQRAINLYLNETLNDNTSFRVGIQDSMCTTSGETLEWTASEIAFWMVCCLLLLLSISSTTADALLSTEPKLQIFKVWMFFSLKRNCRKLVEFEESNQGDALSVFHGFKVASLFIIFLGHQVGISLGISAFNYQLAEEEIRHARNNMFIAHADLLVDSFFFISGLLACYMLVNLYSRKFINPLLIVSARLSRLVPLYFFIVWFQTQPVLRFSSGPLWKIAAKPEADICEKNWWTNILFINNYVPSEQMCMLHSWYVACDFHSFVLSLPLIIVLARRPKLGVTLLVLLTTVSAVVPGLVTYLKTLQPLVLFYNDFFANPRGDRSFDLLYRQTHNRIVVYLIGTLVGYYLHLKRDSKTQISTKTMLGGLLAWVVLTISPMAYGSIFYQPQRPYDALEASFFASLRRVFWALGLAVFIITHRYRRVPILDKLSSSRPVMVLGKLTYALYLVHFNLLMVHSQNTKTAAEFQIYQTLVNFLGYYGVSLIYATLLYLVIELPFKQLSALAFSTQATNVKNNQNVDLNQIQTVRL